jgi:hypothetical protein
VIKEVMSTLDGPEVSAQQQQQQQNQHQLPHRVPPTYVYSTSSEQNGRNHEDGEHRRIDNGQRVYHHQATEDQLGPLPLNWEKAYTESGEVYFIEYVLAIFWPFSLAFLLS